MLKSDVEEGDWVRYMIGGRLVIGQVEYFKDRVCGYTDVYTDVGVIEIGSILEVRKGINECNS